MSRWLSLPIFLLMVLLSACTSLQPRPAASMLGCMQAARAQLPDDGADKRLHCLASAQIARQCSVTEAYLAAMGKEVRDLFGAGDAEWADWRADRVGVYCGRSSEDVTAVEACCAKRGY
jgi:hypothetical protein